MLVGQLHHAMRKRGRKQQVQPLLRAWHTTQHIANIVNKPKVEHSIRFVEHHHFSVFKRKHFLLEVINNSPGCSDKYIDTFFQLLALFFIVGTAISEDRAEFRVFADLHRVFVDLDRKFTSGRQNNGA